VAGAAATLGVGSERVLAGPPHAARVTAAAVAVTAQPCVRAATNPLHRRPRRARRVWRLGIGQGIEQRVSDHEARRAVAPGLRTSKLRVADGQAIRPGWYGNGVLWTHLPWPTQFSRTPSGLLYTKIPWFRARTGTVTVDGRPLHGPPARFAASAGEPVSYGPTRFSPSILAFGRTGCWVVHAHLAGRALEVVLRVDPASPS
jgi:hypothetical protein